MPLVLDKYGNKFGKSEGNALWLDINKTSSYKLYQYLVNVDDSMVISYLKIFTFFLLRQLQLPELFFIFHITKSGMIIDFCRK